MPWYSRLANVFRSEKLNHELEDELHHHLEEAIDRLISQGIAPDEARRLARQRLGNYSLQKEKTRDMNIALWLDEMRADLVYAMRQLKASPVFATVAVLSLALGIGANIAIFQIINAVRLKFLPVKNPGELVALDFDKDSSRGGSWTSRSAIFNYAEWLAIGEQQRSYSGLAAFSSDRFNLTNGGEPRFAQGLFTSGDFFRTLGVSTILGRTYTSADDHASCNAGAVIGYSFWQREFAGDTHVLGQKVSLNGYAVPIIGVTAPSFFGVEVGHQYDVAVPLCADRFIRDAEGRLDYRDAWWLSIIGRLKPGATLQQANAELHTLSPGIMRETMPPEYDAPMAQKFLKNKLVASAAGRGVSDLREQTEHPLDLLMATTALVLLIACANLANLLLARATVREPEMAVRLAIGASRWRIARQLLAESLLLAVSGTISGIGIALVMSRALLNALSSAEDPNYFSVSPDWRLIAFAAALAIVTCLLFGLMPAFRSARVSPSSAMRAGGRSVTGDRAAMRRALVVVQVALSLTLLVGALLSIRSLNSLVSADTGFRPNGLLALEIDFQKADFTKPAERHNAFREIREKFAAIPGVVSVSQVSIRPLSGAGWNNDIGPDETPAAGSGKNIWENRATPGYFRLMGIGIVAGRDFDERDTLTSPRVAIVSQELARKYFPGVNPVGHTFHIEAGQGNPEKIFQIVGVIRDSKYRSVREEPLPVAFFPIAQDEAPGAGGHFVLRFAGPAAPIVNQVKIALHEINPLIAFEASTFPQLLNESVRGERVMAALSTAFGLLATLLATLGLYGVIAYMVARRRKEIGIRMVLGADRASVVRLVLREALGLLAAGLGCGLLISLSAGKMVESILYGVKSSDPLSLLSACALLSAIALLASFIPARRAATNDPMNALRIE